MKAPLPPDEAQRLAALRHYDQGDPLPDPVFDDFTLLAAQICQAPIAMVSLVHGDHQRFKARIGITVAETARDFAFCSHTILDATTVLEVHDASADSRFRNSPWVKAEPHIRFYAGAPLVTRDGHALGALCVMDRTPRTLTTEQLAALRALSRQAVGQLELQRQTRALAQEISERQRAETQLRERCEQVAASEQAASRMLTMAEKSRRALLSVLEDEKISGLKLRNSEERFRQLAENINEVFWMTDPAKQTMLYISPAYEAMWGQTCESLYARPLNWIDAIHPDDRTRVLEAATMRQAIGDYDEIYRIVRPDASQRWIRDRAFPVRNENGEVYRMVGTAEDITERRQAELRTAVQHAITGVLSEAAPLLETARRILEIICRQLEWDVGDLWTVDRTARTLSCVEIWHPPAMEFQAFADASRKMAFRIGEGLLGRVWSARQPQSILDVTQEKGFRRRSHAIKLGLRSAVAFPIRLGSEVFGVAEFFSTRSSEADPELLAMFAAIGTQIGQFLERKQLEDQFRQAQKMEAIGTLAGGIAHDFNNVLAAITGYTELAKMESRDNPEVLGYLQAVLDGGTRAADLVRQILSFSRVQAAERKTIQLWPIVEEALKLLRATIPATIEFDVMIFRRGPTILADPTQIHQVIMNLAMNAAHAMRERPGRLGVILESLEVDAALAATHAGLQPGRYMRLCISDTGHGMDEGTLSRIFNPFFTTKAPGEGTGLGLAVVHGIMQSHDGIITVYSQPAEGTRFELYFPAQADEIQELAVQSMDTPRGQGERILVVDDEASLAAMGEKFLQLLGYVVDAHTAPANAMAAVRAQPDKYDLVITDLTMTGMTGIDLAGQLLKIRPDLPIILTTGYSASLTPERVRAMGIREMVLKPLTINILAEAVHRVITKTKPNYSEAVRIGNIAADPGNDPSSAAVATEL